MKKLTALIGLTGFVGAMSFATSACGEEAQKIKIKDVPQVRVEQLVQSIFADGLLILEYNTMYHGRETCLRFGYPSVMNQYDSERKQLSSIYMDPSYLGIDLNGNGIFEEDEIFKIDYSDVNSEKDFEKKEAPKEVSRKREA